MGQSFSRAVYPYRLEAAAEWDAFRRKYLGKGGVGPGQPRAVGRPLVPETGDIDEDLYNASAADDIATVDRLIKAGADAMAQFGDLDHTSFHVCMSAAVAARLTKSLPVSVQEDLSGVRDGRHNTPLHTCARSNRQDAVLGLIECGFDLLEKNGAGRTAAQVARSFHFNDMAGILDKLANGECWCKEGDTFDLEDSMQLYMNIYAFREPVIEVYSYLADQKQEDMRDELEIRKKLTPLLESREERKQWERNKEKEKKELAAEGKEDVMDLVAQAFKNLDKDLKLLERLEKGGGAGGNGEEEGSEEEGDIDDDTNVPGDELQRKKKKKGKQSLGERIKHLEKDLEFKTDPGRWRAYKNTLGFPRDVESFAEALIVPSLALHIRAGKGCKNRTYICQYCSRDVKRIDEEIHVKLGCSEARIPCKACNLPVIKRFMTSHTQNDCTQREWIKCKRCGCDLKSKELSLHLKTKCSERKKRCRFCQKIVLLREYDSHAETECLDTLKPCHVAGCPAKFRSLSQVEQAARHERMHLQKEFDRWTAAEVSFWLCKSFPFFGDFMLKQYCRRIELHQVTGQRLKAAESNLELRRLLTKAVGMPEDHVYTCVEVLSGRSQVETFAEYPKRVRAGAFVSQKVRDGVAKWDRRGDPKLDRFVVGGKRRSSPYLVLKVKGGEY
jgi:hypothetical protein